MGIEIKTMIILNDKERSELIDFIERNQEADGNFDRSDDIGLKNYNANKFAREFAANI